MLQSLIFPESKTSCSCSYLAMCHMAPSKKYPHRKENLVNLFDVLKAILQNEKSVFVIKWIDLCTNRNKYPSYFILFKISQNLAKTDCTAVCSPPYSGIFSSRLQIHFIAISPIEKTCFFSIKTVKNLEFDFNSINSIFFLLTQMPYAVEIVQ